MKDAICAMIYIIQKMEKIYVIIANINIKNLIILHIKIRKYNLKLFKYYIYSPIKTLLFNLKITFVSFEIYYK